MAVMDPAAGLLTFRVQIPSMSKITTETFDASMLVYDVILAIKAQVKELSEEGAAKHFKLFLAADEYKDGCWLSHDKSLKQLRLPLGALLEFKTSIRSQSVKLMDGKVNDFPIDDSFPVAELTQSFCKAIGFKNGADYALCIDIENDGLDNLDKKFDTFWLNDGQTLRQQNVKPDVVIAFRRRFYGDNRNFSKDDNHAVSRVFGEISEGIISGRLPVLQTEATTCAAVIAQITLGDNAKVDMTNFLPKEYQKKDVLKDVAGRYGRLQGLNEKMAKYRFIVEAKGLKHYGYKFFKVLEKVEGGKWNKEKFFYFGVNPDVVVRVDYSTKEVVSRWPLSKVTRFAASASDFSLDFGNWAHKLYNCCTVEAVQIAEVIGTYYRNIKKCRHAFEELGNVEDLFTMSYDVEELEPEPDYISAEKLGPSRTTEEELAADVVGGRREFDEMVATAMGTVSLVNTLYMAPGEHIQLPDDITGVVDSIPATVDCIAECIFKICLHMSHSPADRDFQVLKQVTLIMTRQVPELTRQMLTIARHYDVVGRPASRFNRACRGLASKYGPFVESIASDSFTDFVEIRHLASDLVLAVLACDRALDPHSEDEPDLRAPLDDTQQEAVSEARTLSGKVVGMLDALKTECSGLSSQPEQEALNNRISYLVDLCAQLFIMTAALVQFLNREGEYVAILQQMKAMAEEKYTGLSRIVEIHEENPYVVSFR